MHRNSDPLIALDIPNTLEAAHNAETQLLAACTQLGFAEEDLFSIRMAVHEALVNAVKHGNKLDPAKRVKLRYRLTGTALELTVEDQGPGFNPDDLPDPTLDENLDRPSGRGVLLMRAYMDEVSFNGVGNAVTMVKQNTGALAARGG